MRKIKNADFEEYRKYRDDVTHGRVLTPDGIKLICQANAMDPQKIGDAILEVYGRFKAEGVLK